MFDMHYDLLTILYFNMKKNNPVANIDKVIKDCIKIYRKGNILGGIVNLYFMTPEEMLEEINITKEEMIDIKTMFLKSISYVDSFKELGYISPDTQFIYGIEGCDYIKNPDMLEELYNYGLRSIIPVWNHENQYGSGNRTEKGLTIEGQELIKKAIDLGIIIDVSHANEQTFSDILDIVEKDERAIVIASHSNVRTLCDRKRNLSDEQIIRLANAGGYIGLFTNGNFVSLDNEKLTYIKREQNFAKHIRYLIDELHVDPNKIILSTDDMNYNPIPDYHCLEVASIEKVANNLFKLISSMYGDEIATKILIDNAFNLINKVKEKKKIK